MGYIYQIVNDINDKVYVGKTCRALNERFNEHVRAMSKRFCEKRPLYYAMNKYGAEHFSIRLLEECEDSELDNREKYWIRAFDSRNHGYNATDGGDGALRFDHSAILDELVLNPYPAEVARCVGCSQDLVRSIAKQHGISVKHNTEFLRKYSPQKEIVGDNGKEFVCFDSACDAAKWVFEAGLAKTLNSGVRSHIVDCANGKRHSAYGYNWKYSYDNM